jgi:hypothetical protein
MTFGCYETISCKLDGEASMKQTKHFQVRQSQRSISDFMVRLILDGGDIIEEQVGGSKRIQLSIKEQRRIGKRLRSLVRNWDNICDVVVVEHDSALITTYHKH